mmetsp:Transcript_21851/g.65495  ORF Transcript_21851/g.65495 Transcript_21851/m.65495 type:complete len:230 (+) Transcript_21851:255-944(+)
MRRRSVSASFSLAATSWSRWLWLSRSQISRQWRSSSTSPRRPFASSRDAASFFRSVETPFRNAASAAARAAVSASLASTRRSSRFRSSSHSVRQSSARARSDATSSSRLAIWSFSVATPGSRRLRTRSSVVCGLHDLREPRVAMSRLALVRPQIHEASAGKNTRTLDLGGVATASAPSWTTSIFRPPSTRAEEASKERAPTFGAIDQSYNSPNDQKHTVCDSRGGASRS